MRALASFALALACTFAWSPGAEAQSMIAADASRSFIVSPDPAPPRDPLESRTEVGFGMLAGHYSVGPIGGSAAGVHVDLGHHFGKLALVGEYDLLSVGNDPASDKPIRGHMHRGGLSARYSLLQLGGDDFFIQGDFWVEAGLGAERVRWHGGGELDRPDVSAGFGAQCNFRVGEESPKVIGVFYAFRFLGAKGPGADSVASTCAGPCDRPTEPYAYDLGWMFNLGLVFGR